MGSGTWSDASFSAYTTTTKGVASVDDFINTVYCAQDLYKSRRLAKVLDPKGAVRECRNSEEHPHTLPVILALDVTGSMGGASVEVAKKLNEIMTSLYADKDVPDVEFCIMGIGDLAYDDAPIQMSQFESDIRIAEQLDAIWFEGGGGGNIYESYTAAWYMGLKHCKLDCWGNGEKGIIITMGDECPNPILPKIGACGGAGLKEVTGDTLQGDIETKELLPEVLEKFDVYHLSIDDEETSYRSGRKSRNIDGKWKELLGENYMITTIDGLANKIVDIIKNHTAGSVFTTATFTSTLNDNGEITW